MSVRARRVAVMNFTELPVACRLENFGGMASRYEKTLASEGAALAYDGATLRLRPHAQIIVD